MIPGELNEMGASLPIPIKDRYTPVEAATLLRMSRGKLFDLAKRKEDPFPIRRLEKAQRGSIVFRDEMLDWARRNFAPLAGR